MSVNRIAKYVAKSSKSAVKVSSSPKAEVRCRWLIRRDMAEVIRIDSASFSECWGDEDFLYCLRKPTSIGNVCEHGPTTVGFMVYELLEGQINLVRMAVDPEFQRRGVGSQMIGNLKNKLVSQRRNAITILVRESNLTAQLFFKRHGFKAVCVVEGHFEDGEDAYQFRFELPE